MQLHMYEYVEYTTCTDIGVLGEVLANDPTMFGGLRGVGGAEWSERAVQPGLARGACAAFTLDDCTRAQRESAHLSRLNARAMALKPSEREGGSPGRADFDFAASLDAAERHSDAGMAWRPVG